MASYADTTDLDALGLPAATLGSVSTDTQQRALAAASALVDSYLRAHVPVPLTTWGDDVRRATVHIASWDLMCRRGFDPQSPSDMAVRQRYEDAMAWLKMVAGGTVFPVGVEPDAEEALDEVSAASSDDPRGW